MTDRAASPGWWATKPAGGPGLAPWLCAGLLASAFVAGHQVQAQQLPPPPASQPAAAGPRAAASAERPTNEALFKEADKDKDGMLNRAEAEQVPGLQERFDTIDTDKDGLLTIEEFKRGMTG